jgi:hypothetical protein
LLSVQEFGVDIAVNSHTVTRYGRIRPPPPARRQTAGRVAGVTTREELDALSSRELHDRAVRRALHHADAGFLWELLRAIPAAEAAEGHPAHAGIDITKVSALLSDAMASGEADIADALRPLYIDYLTKHNA